MPSVVPFHPLHARGVYKSLRSLVGDDNVVGPYYVQGGCGIGGAHDGSSDGVKGGVEPGDGDAEFAVPSIVNTTLIEENAMTDNGG
jgi:hypothetical protein